MRRDTTHIYCRKYYSYTIEKLLKSIFILFIATIILPAVTYAVTPVIVAGNGSTGYSGDEGAAISAKLWNPWTIDVDSNGNLFIADTINHRIRRVDAITQIITTVAGNGSGGTSGDGSAATSASIGNPHGLAVDSNVNLFFADTVNNNIRRVDANTDIITTVANLNTAFGVAVDNAGNLFIADTTNNQILRVDAVTNTITTAVSGAGLSSPYGVDVDSNGNLYVTDTFNSRIIRVDAVTGLITTIVNNPGFVFDLSIDEAGNIFYVTWNHPAPSSHGTWKWDINTGTSSMLTTIPNGQGIGIGGSDVYVTSNNAVYKLAGVADSGNQPPVAVGTLNSQVEHGCRGCGRVRLDGTGSFDPDNDPIVSYTWTGPFGTATGATPTVTMPLGTSNVNLIVNDGTVDSEPDTVIITITDTKVPKVRVKLKKKPKKGCFRVEFSVKDICDPDPTVVALLNGISVTNGQVVKLIRDDDSSDDDSGSGHKKKKKRKKHHGGDKSSDDSSCDENNKVTFKGSKFTLTVTATDDSENVGTGTDTFVFPPKRYRGDHRKFKNKLKKLKKKWRKRYSSHNNSKGCRTWRKWRNLRKRCRRW
jgi:sugar lactone lactonase YvrE